MSRIPNVYIILNYIHFQELYEKKYKKFKKKFKKSIRKV